MGRACIALAMAVTAVFAMVISVSAATYFITIDSSGFSNNTLNINVGDAVTWTNQHVGVNHSVVSDTGNEMNSSALNYTQSYSHNFTTNGTYPYHCGIHTTERGTIIVGVNQSQTPSNATCAVEITNINVTGNTIFYTIRNTGNAVETVNYNVTVSGSIIYSGSVSLNSGAGFSASNNYNFNATNFGSYEVKVSTRADCGANHSATMTHWVFDRYTCSNPPGTETQNRCDYSTGRYLTCRSGLWVSESQDAYCNNCRYHCGDGVCSCGEAYSSCPADCQSSCTEGFTNQYACDGAIQQRQYKYRNCTTTWVSQTLCSGGCYDGSCSGPPTPNCGVQITSFDYTNNVMVGTSGYVTVSAKNTGDSTTRINTSLWVDSILRDYKYQNVNPNAEFIASLYYPSGTSGQHTITIKSKAGCGSEDSRGSFINTVTEPSQPVGPNPPGPTPPQPKATLVSFYPSFIDSELYTSKIVGVSIVSSKSQDFTITATGLPDGWIQLTSPVTVSDERTAYIYVTPKATGNYTLHVTAKAALEPLNFSADIPVFVIESKSVQAEGFLGELISQIKAALKWLLDNPLFLIALLIVILIIVVAAGHHHLKREKWPLGG